MMSRPLPEILVSDDVYEIYGERLAHEYDGSFFVRRYASDERFVDESIRLDRIVAVITKSELPQAFYDRASNLRLIQAATSGYESFDLDRARKSEVFVANNGGANSTSVAEHCLLLMLTLSRQLLAQEIAANHGCWNNLKHTNLELEGKTAGVIGLGRVGFALATRLEALGMKVLFHDIREEIAGETNFERVTKSELIRTSDYISVHVPYSRTSRDLIGASELKEMKPSVFVINTSRGGVINEADLIEALESKQIRGAALDVFESEPLPQDSRFLELDNVVLTPHCGPSKETIEKLFTVFKQNLDRLNDHRPFLYPALEYD